MQRTQWERMRLLHMRGGSHVQLLARRRLERPIRRRRHGVGDEGLQRQRQQVRPRALQLCILAVSLCNGRARSPCTPLCR